MRMIEDHPDQQDQPVELGFPMGYAMSWGYPQPPFATDIFHTF